MTATWHILGAGAIGRLMACKLQRMGLHSCLLTRPAAPADGRIELIAGADNRHFDLPTKAVNTLDRASIHALIISTKAGDAVTAFRQVAHALTADTRLLLLHNGMGVYEQLCALHPHRQIFCGSTTDAVWRRGTGQLVHAGQGETQIGQHDRAGAPGWFAAFADSDQRFSWTPDIAASLWRKLLINCAINPLTALHRCRNGALLANTRRRAELQAVCAELAAVAAARDETALAADIAAQTIAVIRSTAANRSSMLLDVLRGNRTEIDYITGYFCREASRLKLPCPRNRALLAALRRIDRSR